MSLLVADRVVNAEAAAAGHGECRAGRSPMEVRFEHSLNLARILEHIGASLVLSTYQAGKLAVVGVDDGALALSFHNFERAMGVAVRRDRIALGTTTQVWFLRAAPEIARRMEPPGKHDGCFLTRSSHFTGDIQIHELAWSGEELWLVNTAFSCLCTLDEHHSFVPRWRPPFISDLAGEDRCHLNGLAVVNGQAKYVTALGETDTPCGWRAGKVTGGCLIDVPSGETVASGFAMPHAPRVHEGRIYLLDSGRGLLVTLDPATGKVDCVAELPGYARGLAIYSQFAFVGLSRIRETATFGGVPISERNGGLKCGLAVVNLASGRQMAWLEFQSVIHEIFDVQLIPGMLLPALSGPNPVLDGGAPIWLAPEPRRPRGSP